MTDFEPRDDASGAWREARVAAMETVLGPSEVALGDGVGRPGRVAGVEVLLFRNHLEGVVATKSGLIGRDDQIPNGLGNYELAVACRGDGGWWSEILCSA